jgi:hypothetical protein
MQTSVRAVAPQSNKDDDDNSISRLHSSTLDDGEDVVPGFSIP